MKQELRNHYLLLCVPAVSSFSPHLSSFSFLPSVPTFLLHKLRELLIPYKIQKSFQFQGGTVLAILFPVKLWSISTKATLPIYFRLHHIEKTQRFVDLWIFLFNTDKKKNTVSGSEGRVAFTSSGLHSVPLQLKRLQEDLNFKDFNILLLRKPNYKIEHKGGWFNRWLTIVDLAPPLKLIILICY